MPLEQNPHPTSCPHCHQSFQVSASESAHFCPLCGGSLEAESSVKPKIIPPPTSDLLSHRYQLLESIGKGGMGEVFLVYDTLCGRRIALKKIRTDLLEHPQIRHRFLKEAHITCQLTHPAIIPIYSIQSLQLSAYYTMPFVEGETLKQIIRKTRQQEKKGEKLDHIGGSIPALMRVFITICHAVAYAHSKGVLHRDLKPENIIIGKYGEVLILDWGLAKYIHSPPSEGEEIAVPPKIPLPVWAKWLAQLPTWHLKEHSTNQPRFKPIFIPWELSFINFSPLGALLKGALYQNFEKPWQKRS
jgi:eukaryotic-like serine/threonine-protein kinase